MLVNNSICSPRLQGPKNQPAGSQSLPARPQTKPARPHSQSTRLDSQPHQRASQPTRSQPVKPTRPQSLRPWQPWVKTTQSDFRDKWTDGPKINPYQSHCPATSYNCTFFESYSPFVSLFCSSRCRAQSPVEWRFFPFVPPFVYQFVHLSICSSIPSFKASRLGQRASKLGPKATRPKS